MKNSISKPPSRIKYEKNHPVISVRVDMDLLKRLNSMAKINGESRADFLKAALKQQVSDDELFYMEGYEKGKNDFAVYYQCSECGKDLVISSPKEKQAAAQYMKEHGWVHVACLNSA